MSHVKDKRKICLSHAHTALVILTANPQSTGLTQRLLMGFGPHFGRTCWRAVLLLLLFLLIVAILSDFGNKPEQSVFHFFLGKTGKVILVLSAVATALPKGPHDYCSTASPQPVTEQHHHPSWRPGLTACFTPKPVRRWANVRHMQVFTEDQLHF